MAKPRLLLDVDGIVADFIGATLKILSRYAGREVKREEIVQWEVTEVLEEQAYRDHCKDEFNEAGFASTFRMYDGAQPAVEKMKEMCDLYFVTVPMVRNPTWMPDRMAWLIKHFNVEPKHVCFITDKSICAGDIMVDDHPDHINGFLTTNPRGVGMLWDRPYNQVVDHPRTLRVSSWDEIIKKIETVISQPRE